MGKVAVVYWSGTGNTEAMAESVLQGVLETGGEGELLNVCEFTEPMIDSFDTVAFGCPSMGCEALEESEFEPAFSRIEDKLNQKRIALFGSYGWGDGQWMREWEKRCTEAGAVLACSSVICNEAPEQDTIEACRNMGKVLAEN